MALEGIQASTKGRWYLIAEQGDLTALVYPGMLLGEDATGCFSLTPTHPLIELGVAGDLLCVRVLTRVDGVAPPPLYVNADTRVRVNLPHDSFIIDPAWASGQYRGDVIDIQVQPHGEPPAPELPEGMPAAAPRWISEREFGVLVTIGMLVLGVILLSWRLPSSPAAASDTTAIDTQESVASINTRTDALIETALAPASQEAESPMLLSATEASPPGGASVADMTPEEVADLSTDLPADQTGFGSDVAEVVPLLDALPLSGEPVRQLEEAVKADLEEMPGEQTAADEQALAGQVSVMQASAGNGLEPQLTAAEGPATLQPENAATSDLEVEYSGADALGTERVQPAVFDEVPAEVPGSIPDSVALPTNPAADWVAEILSSELPPVSTLPGATSSALPLARRNSDSFIDVALSSLSPGIASPVLPRPDEVARLATTKREASQEIALPGSNAKEPQVVDDPVEADALFPYGDLTVLRQRAPVYPRRAPTGASGYVDLTFTVNENGRVEAVKVEGNPPEYFARAAVAAVSKWRFESVRVDGRAVAVRTMLRLSFQG